MKPGSPAWRASFLAGGLLASLALVAAATRPLLPIDETRYAAVAWEMWLRGDWLVPHLNGRPYGEKGPLTFWLVHAGWAAFGVSQWWLRLVPALCAGGSLAATALLARLLWPERPQLAQRAPLLLVRRQTHVLTLLRSAPWWAGAVLLVLGAWTWRRRDANPDASVRDIAISIGLLAISAHLGVVRVLSPAYDLSDVGARLHRAEQEGRSVAHAGRYEGQFQFAGRLRRTPELIERNQVGAWLEGHPDGLVVDYTREALPDGAAARPPLVRPYRGQTLVLWTRGSFPGLPRGSPGRPESAAHEHQSARPAARRESAAAPSCARTG